MSDLTKLLLLVWMCGSTYFMYKMYINLDYMTELVSAYIRMVVEYSRH